jgi:tetratricopeptide (TPR) repeat protein
MREPDVTSHPPFPTQLFWGGGLLAVLCITALLYWPGLAGTFMLDDIPNLSPLAENPSMEASERAFQFVLSGRSSPLGRPLALSTFLLNDHAWPSGARPFKYTNLMIHLLNGALLFWLLWLVCRYLPGTSARRQGFVALATAAFWLLHPLNVSTVLYVIQRMTELGALFTIAGMIVYLKARLAAHWSTSARYLVMSAGVGGGLALGVLSKETAINMPLYLLTLEYTLLAAWVRLIPRPRGWSLWALAFLYAPVLAVTGWQVLRWSSITAGYQTRPFNLAERLMTEPRILFDYLQSVLVPRRAGTGLFHDDFVVSQSLTDPLTTLLAIGALTAALALAIVLRRRVPVFSFAVLWFVSGHILEAGPWPLELYFEHRNYLPMLGPLFAVVVLFSELPGRLRLFGPAAVSLLIGLAAFTTWLNTSLWGSASLLAETWADEHPYSQRAQQFSASVWSQYQRYDLAELRIRRLLERIPDATSGYAALVQLNCVQGREFETVDLPRVLQGLRQGKRDPAAPETLQLIARLKYDGLCPGLDYENVEQMADALLDNPNFQKKHLLGNLYFIKADLGVLQRDFPKAAGSLDIALKYHPNVDLALMQANLYASANMYEEALESVARATQLDHHRVLGVSVKQETIEQVRRRILKARDNQQ